MSDSETVAMLAAAEQIADGLADLARAIYDRDERWKHALAAANAASVQMQDARREAERPTDDEYASSARD
jgi:membrane-bound lytic murein transglycosylase MltF